MEKLTWKFTIDQINKFKLEPHGDVLDGLLEQWFSANENQENTTQDEINEIEYEILLCLDLG